MSTDGDWRAWGERDPYFGVIAHEQFRLQKLTPQAFEEFFREGRAEVNEILEDCRRFIGPISTRRTLEFGCGVGRMLVPLAEQSERSVGIDISAAMLAEATRNCAKFNCHNVRLVDSIEAAAALEPEGFTLIYSYIVLQHIDPRRGLHLIAALLACVAKSGCAVLHVTYARNKYRDNFGVQPFGHGVVRRIRYPLSRLARRLRNRDPQMQMNAYDINRILFIAQQQGVRSGGFRFTDHTGHLGVILYFKRE